MRRKGRLLKKNTGFTLTELIVTLAVSAVVLSASVIGIVAWVHHADFVRNENYAETIYYAAQSELTRYRSNGQLGELEEYVMKEGFHVPVEEVTDDYRETLTAEELKAYNEKYADRLYYLKKGAGEEEPDEMLNRLLEPYIYDGSIMDGAICIEFDPGDGTVYSVTYSDRNTVFTYEKEPGEGKFSLADRTKGSRKESRVGYYCTDLSEAAPTAVGKTRVGEVVLVNEEQLYLKWSLPDLYSKIRGFLSYTIEIYDKSDDSLQYTFVVKGSSLRESGEGDVGDYLITCTESATKKKYVFLAGMDNAGAMYLVFDSMDYGVDPEEIKSVFGAEGTDFDTEAFRNSASVLQLFSEPEDIYVRIQAQGEPYKTSAWKQSNTSNTLFASMEEESVGGGLSRDVYEIRNARHLYNIRYREKENALAGNLARETCYRQVADIAWPVAEKKLFHSVSAVGGGLEIKALEAGDKCLPSGGTDETTTVPYFPAIPRLEDASRLEATAGRGYELKGFVLYQEGDGGKLGLVAENRGTIEGLRLTEADVQGVRNVGAVCGINTGSGKIRHTAVSGKVSGLENVGGIVGADDAASVRDPGAAFDAPLSESELERSHYKDLTNYAEVTGRNGKVGGIVGSLEKNGLIYLCENYGAAKGTETCSVYIGGITGYNKGIVQSCLSAPKDTAPEKEQASLKGIFVGGIAGCNNGGVIRDSGTEKESKSMAGAGGDAYVIGYRYVGGIVGYNNSRINGGIDEGTVGTLLSETGRTNRAKIIGHDYVGGIVGANGRLENAAIIEDITQITPEDKALYEICEIEESYSEKMLVADWINEGLVSAVGSYASDGIYDAEGLYGGGIAGYNAGDLRSCTTKINTSAAADDLLAYAVLYGKDSSYIGGIAGYNVGHIYNEISSEGETTIQVNSVAAGRKYVGGVVGYNAAVEGENAENSGVIKDYALTGGYLSGECFVGGYVGLNTTEKLLGKENKIQSNPNKVEADYFAGGVMGALILVPENSEATEVAVNCGTDNYFGTVEAKNAFAGGYVAYTQLLTKDSSASGSDAVRGRAEAIYEMLPKNVTEENRHRVLQDFTERFLDTERVRRDSLAKLTFSYEAEGGENRFASVSAPVFAGGIIGCNSWDTTLLLQGIDNKVAVSATDSVSYPFISSLARETFSFAGGIVGLVTPKATIDNCRNSNGGGVSGKGTFSGGVAEVNLGHIIRCKTGSVSGKNGYGGIAGLNTNEGEIMDCHLIGQISGESYLGGIVMRNESIVKDCTVENNANRESAVTGTGEYIGGIAAVNRVKAVAEGDPAETDKEKKYPNALQSCIVRADVGAQNRGQYVGGLIGRYEGGTLADNRTEGNVKVYGDQYVGGIVGEICANLTGEQNGPFTIVNSAGVTAVREAGGIGGRMAEKVTLGYCKNIGRIEATQGRAGGILPVVEYASNQVVQCENNGSVLTVRDAAGGIAAVNYGLIQNCHTASAGGELLVEGKTSVGGIAGENRNMAENCWVAGKVFIRNVNSRETGMAIGGIAGLNTGMVRNTGVSFAQKTGGESPRIYSQGDGDYLGGIAGKNIQYGDHPGHIEGVVGTGSTAPEVNLTVELNSGQSGAVGGAAGANGGKISGIMFSGTVNGTQGSAYGTGGIAGRNDMPGRDGTGTISGCVLKGTVRAQGAAGFTGFTERDAGVYVGGICGFNPEGGLVTGCSLAGGNVSGNNGYVGGIAAYNLGELTENRSGEYSAATIENSGISAGGMCVVGGITAYNGETGSLTNCETGRNWSVNNRMTGGAEKTPTGGIIGCNQSVHDQKGLINRAAVRGDWMTGGIIGLQQTEKRGDFTIEGCRNEGAVIGRIRTAGGIISDWRYQSGRVRECINTGEISIEGSDSRNGAGGIIGTGWWGGAVSITIERCGNEGKIWHCKNGSSGKAAGIFGSYNCNGTSLDVTITDCYNAAEIQNEGVASAGILAGKESGGTMKATILRCVNYGKGTNSNKGFAGIGWNRENRDANEKKLPSDPWTVDRCVNIGECYGSQNPIVMPANEYTTGKNYYFMNPSGGYQTSTAKTVKVAERTRNGNSFTAVKPAEFSGKDDPANRLYYEGKGTDARYLQFQEGVPGATNVIIQSPGSSNKGLKDIYSAPGATYALLLYGKEGVTKLNPPTALELSETDDAYRIGYTADPDTEFCTDSYKVAFYGRKKEAAAGSEELITEKDIVNAELTRNPWEIKKTDLPSLDQYEEIWVKMQAVAKTDSGIDPSDWSDASNRLGMVAKLPTPKLFFEVVREDNNAGDLEGYWVLGNPEDYAGYSNWKIDIENGTSGGGTITGAFSDGNYRSVKCNYGSSEANKTRRIRAYAYAADKTTYRESDVFADMFRLYTENETLCAARVNDEYGEFIGTKAGDFKYRVRMKQAKNNTDHITYRADFLVDGVEMGYGLVELPLQQGEADCTIDLSSLKQEDLRKIMNYIENGTAGKVQVRYYPWELDGIRYYVTGTDKEIVRRTVPTAWNNAGSGAFNDSLQTLDLNKFQGKYKMYPMPVLPKTDYKKETGADGLITYTFHWDARADIEDIGSSYDDADYRGGTYMVTIIGKNTETATEVVLKQQEVQAWVEADRVLSVMEDNWKYDEISVTVERIGGVAGNVTYIGASAENTYDIPIRLDSVPTPRASLPDQNELSYKVEWDTSLYSATERAKIQGYRIVVSGTDKDGKPVTETEEVAGAETGEAKVELSLGKYASFREGTEITFKVITLSSDQKDYLDSMPSSGVTLPVYEQLALPQGTQSLMLEMAEVDADVPLGPEKFTDFVLQQQDDSATTEDATSTYEVEYFIAGKDGLPADWDETADKRPEQDTENGIYISSDPVRMTGNLKTASLPLAELDAYQAGRSIWYRIRAVSNNKVSSAWTQWREKKLPKAILATVEMTEDTAENTWPYTITGGTTTGASYEVKMSQPKINFMPVDFAAGYKIRLKETDKEKEKPDGTTETIKGPEHLYMLVENPNADSEIPLVLEGSASPPETREEADSTIYTYRLDYEVVHSFEISRDSTTFLYEITVAAKLSYRVKNGEVQELWLELPEGKCMDSGGNEIGDRAFTATAFMDVTVIPPTVADDDPLDPRYIVEKLRRWQRVEDPDDPTKNTTKIEEISVADAAVETAGIQGYYLEMMEEKLVGDGVRELFGLEKRPAESTSAEEGAEEEPTDKKEDVSGNDVAKK